MVKDFGSVKEFLVHKIRMDGPVSFKDFMAIALYEEDLGYYSQQEIRIGKNGDFVTAPHTSKLFGYLLSVQIKQFFEIIKAGEELCIAEFGAGTGVLAKDVLEYFSKFYKNDFERLKYVIVEPLKIRRKVLKTALVDFEKNVEIIRDISEIEDLNCVVMANELFDAFPVHLIEKKDGNFFEIFIDADQNGNLFEKGLEIKDKELKEYIRTHLLELPDGYRTEVNLGIKRWIEDLSKVVAKCFCLIIDYGYSRADYYADYRNRGTLLGYFRQNVTEDFLKFPGMIDMTAHVNFSDVKTWFENSGFKPAGFCPQWAFLGGLDIEKTIKNAFGKLDPFSPVLATVKSLIFPQGMGESHKVFVASKGVERETELKGFKMKNDIERLTE